MKEDEGESPSADTSEWREYDIHEDSDVNVGSSFLFEKDQEWEFFNYNVQTIDNKVKTLKIRHQSDYTHSTGVSIWNGAQILSDYLQENAKLARDCVVWELGAGTGLPSLTASLLGASRVCITDGDVDVLENLEYNIQENMATDSITCRQLIWGRTISTVEKESVDVILASDVFYISASFAPFWKTAKELLHPKGLVLAIHVASSQVDGMEEVCQVARQYGFDYAKMENEIYKFQPLV